MCVKFLKSFGVPMLVLGGGGYTIRNVARCWTYETGVLLDMELDDRLPYNEYLEYYGPDYRLHIEPSNMDNLNTPEYLQANLCVIFAHSILRAHSQPSKRGRIRQELIENLRHIEGAPSVAQHERPPDAFTYSREKDEDEMDPDRRLTRTHTSFSHYTLYFLQ